MKRSEIIFGGFADAVPVACGMIAMVSAAPTAYGIGFSVLQLVLFCAVSALLLSFWLHVPRYGIWFGAALLIGFTVLIIARFQQILDGGTVLIYRVLDALPGSVSRSIDMEQLLLKTEAIPDQERCVTVVLMLIALAFGLLITFTLIHCKMSLLSLLVPLPPLLLGLYYVDMQPALWTIVLLSFYCGYAVLGISLRRSDKPKAAAFFSALAPLMLGFSMLLFAVFPQSRFQPISLEMRQKMLSETFGAIGDKALEVFGRSNPKEIDLNGVGDRGTSPEEVFKVRSNRSGAFHLRTHSYGAYGRNKWLPAPEYGGEWSAMKALGERQPIVGSSLSIMDSVSNERIVPYAFLAENDVIVGESSVRASGMTSYSFPFARTIRTDPKDVTEEEAAYYAFALEQYTMQDGPERDALIAFAREAGIARTGDDLDTARSVAGYLQTGNGYRYTLTPGDLPEGKDFILYFLRESKSGYCVHFASATTALLQALGIPARYTIGYYYDIPEEYGNFDWHSVPQSAEHAWTEVYIRGVGWLPVDGTPGTSTEGSPDVDPGGNGSGTQVSVTPTPEPFVPLTPTPFTPATEEPSATPVSPFGVRTEEPLKTPEPSSIIGEEQPYAPKGEKEEEKPHDARWLLLLIPLLPAAWIGIGMLIRRFREARFANRDNKRAIPEMAHYLNGLTKYGYPKDPDAYEWALEAVFSDHTMTDERKKLRARVHKAQKTALREKPVKRFILRWILFRI